MDNNMNGMDYNNIPQQPFQDPNVVTPQPMDSNLEPQIPVQPVEPNMGPQPVQQPVPPMEPVQPIQQPVEQPVQQPMGPQPMNPNMGPMPQGDVPVINVEQTPTEVFGQQVNTQQPNDPTRMNQMIDSINSQQQPVEPKYGYNTNEQKPNLNADSNVNLKVVIFIAIIIFGFIMALPYLSSMMDK